MPDLSSNREKQSEEVQPLSTDKTSVSTDPTVQIQVEPQPSTSGCQLVKDVALVSILQMKLSKILFWD